MASAVSHPVFYFSFDSPDAYLAAERVLQTIEGPCEWIPIRANPMEIDRSTVEATADERQLLPLRWPAAFDPELALRAATFAKSIGRSVAFTLAAFRQAYAGGADLADSEVILIAAAGCEMHPRAVLTALERDAIERTLSEASTLAAERGVTRTPTVWFPDGTLLEGDAALDHLAAA